MSIVIFILILSILVLVHEFGHFIAAKRNGIRVEEFGLGLPPRIWGKKIGETLYSLNILPFGGFVKLTGEDSIEEVENNKEVSDKNGQPVNDNNGIDEGTDHTMSEDLDNNEKIIIEEETRTTRIDTEGNILVEEKFFEEVLPLKSVPPVKNDNVDAENNISTSQYDSHSFAIKTPWQRLQVLCAGVFMNLVLAVILFYVFFLISGFKTYQLPLIFDYKFPFGKMNINSTVVGDVKQDSGAEKAGIKIGESIESIDGVPVKNLQELRAQLVGKYGKEVNIELVNVASQNDIPERRVLKVAPSLDEAGNPVLGVYLTRSVVISYDSTLEKLLVGPLHSYNVMAYSLNSLYNIVKLSFRTHDIEPVSQSVAGPVGIYNLVDWILKNGGTRKWLTIMDYIALMSLSLAFVNILPFPALDGGRVLFVLIEAVRGKKVNPVWEANLHRIGMLILLAFIILITIKDLFL